jgi:hypothetical protein
MKITVKKKDTIISMWNPKLLLVNPPSTWL